MSKTSPIVTVPPHIIPGTLHQQNQTAFDWGWHGLIAYGCHSTVVVVDSKSIQLIQTLTHHKANITKVQWSPTNLHHSFNYPYSLKLASVDHSSQCVIWDVTQGTVSTEFSLGSKQLVDLQWLTMNESCRDLLAVFLAPNMMTIWNADTGTKVNRFSIGETILDFVFDPFMPENLILRCPDCFIFINEFNLGRSSTTAGKKFYLTSGDNSIPPLPGRGKTPSHLKRRLVSGDLLRGEETLHFTDSVQMFFSPSRRHNLFIVFPREVTIIDMEIYQAVGIITLERSASPFSRILPCTQRDILCCLHENGCVSVRVQKGDDDLPSMDLPLPNVSQSDSRVVRYVVCGLSEPLRISKSCRVFAGALCPTTEKQVAVLTSEGRILFWECDFEQVGVYGQELPNEADLYHTLISAHPVHGVDLVSLVHENESYSESVEEGREITLADTVAPGWFTPPNGCTSTFGLLSLKLTLTKLWAGISSTPTTIRMGLPLTTRNWSTYAPLLAIGTHNGSILIYNLSKKMILKEFSVHACPVHGIEWIGYTSFVSYGYTSPNPSGNVRNEVAITDIRTGKVTCLKRPDVVDSYQTPIDSIKVSHHKHFLVVKYVNRPMEFYDVRTNAFLRELVSTPPSFSCVEWCPNQHKSKSQKADSRQSLKSDTSIVDFDLAMGAPDNRSSQMSGREILTVIDDNGCMWQMSIDGSKVKVINSTPAQTWLNTPTHMVWKADVMMAGDINGMLFFYNSKDPHARAIETPRAPVKKIRFAPGKGNSKLLVLYTSRLDIRDFMTDAVVNQMRWGSRESYHVVEDAEWAASDKLILLTADGCIRVFDVSLQTGQSAIDLELFQAPVFCPHAIPPTGGFRVKCLLQHQPWHLEYSLDYEPLSMDNAIEDTVKYMLEALPDEYCCALLNSKLGTAERCLLAAGLYGDQREVTFWTMALYYIIRDKNRRLDPQYEAYNKSLPSNPSSDLIRPDSDASISIGGVSLHQSFTADDMLGSIISDTEVKGEGLHDVNEMLCKADLKTLDEIPPLDLCYDLLCDSKTFKRVQLDKVLLHDSRRQTYEQTRKCAEILMLLGQTDRAVQMLLETDSSSDSYYNDALKACLAATIRSSGASQSTIKLVATNLIANSRLFEGVQLLCLIDKGHDSCRYLQTYGEWYQSVWLAKATLNEKESNDVFGRWAEHLASAGTNQKNKSLLILISLGQFFKVIEILYSMRYFDQAALFAESCLEHNLIEPSSTTTPLLEAVFLEYGRYLHKLNLKRGARYYCNKAGENGGKMLNQWSSESLSIHLPDF